MDTFQDIQLTCICGEQFTWTSGEQTFMHDLYNKGKLDGRVVAPKRCKACRLKKKRERDAREEQGGGY